MCGWVPSAGQVSLSVSVGWGDTTFHATPPPSTATPTSTLASGGSAELRVLVSLRYYAGASYLDVCALAGLAPSTFHGAVLTITDAVMSTPERQMSMPIWDASWRRRTAEGLQ